LRKEHEILLAKMDRVRQLGISTQAGRDELMSMRRLLVAHLGKEDSELYPALEKASRTNPALKSTLDLFATEMKSITHEVMRFFDKYEHDRQGLSFGSDSGRILGVLKTRIQREERILYREYERLG
jgi:hypothetical protein